MMSNNTVNTNITINQNQFGYHSKNLTQFCGDFTEEYTDNFNNPQLLPKVNFVLPKTFKVMTWNIWGMNKHDDLGDRYAFINELMMVRMEEVVKCIVNEDPDIIVLQEMSHEALGMIKGFMRVHKLSNIYKGYGHHFTTHSLNNFEQNLNRDLDNYVFTKYVPNKITQYRLNGNLGYTTGVTCVFIGDVCIIGCYLQAGSKSSPGQELVWHHYARCRSEQLSAINEIINTHCSNKEIILCGDFNMNLDGDLDEWPETKYITELGMQDTWRKLFPDKIMYPGFTEDTEINHMRWNYKFMEKRYRYDGIFLKSQNISINDSKLIGLNSSEMDEDMFSDFARLLSKKTSYDGFRSHTYHPSDHFGVMTSFTME